MMNILDACKNNNVEELIVASSSETYQTPTVVPTPETERLIVPDPMNQDIPMVEVKFWGTDGN